MTTFNSTFDWDSTLEPSISNLNENEFLLLLQKQFPGVTAATGTPGLLSKDQPSVGASPQSLNKFPMPNTASPLSTDSSPSPPSANDDASLNGSDSNNNGNGKPADEEHHKRKASADDFDDEINGQPSAKTQHTDAKSKKTGQVRRKSGGGEKTQDESRLLKRKEQNRAAQRAFRERKEKHVKDLEDKVAQLEAKTETQAAENENLRDMLGRLQNENVVLKQSAFTFAVPSSSSSATGQDNTRDSSRTPSETLNLFASSSSSAGPSRAPANAGSSGTPPSSHDSPSSFFEGFEDFSRLSLPNGDASSASPSVSTPNVNASTSNLDLDTMTFFGSPGPFTTISSNPMFTSYRDPVQSMNAFGSFGGWDGDINMTGSSSGNDNSSSGLEGLFGDQFSGLAPFPSDFLTGDGKNSPSGSSVSNALSPIGSHKSSGSATGAHTDCPKTKQDIERMIASGPKGTFGESPVVDKNSPDSASAPTPARQNSNGSDYESAFQQALGKTQTPKTLYSGDNFNIDELCLEMQRKAKCSFAASSGVQCT